MKEKDTDEGYEDVEGMRMSGYQKAPRVHEPKDMRM